MTNYAERRVLSILLAKPRAIDLAAEDFENVMHRELYAALDAETENEIADLHVTDDVKMLALSFLLLIGTSLVAEGLHFHIPKGYIYFAMGFSVLVEVLNLRSRGKRKPIHLRNQYTDPATTEGGETVAKPTGAAGH